MEYTGTEMWNKRIDQLYEAYTDNKPADEISYRAGFFDGLNEAKNMFSSAQFSDVNTENRLRKKTKQVVRAGKEWRFA